jgi:hypothetical protein
MPRRIYISCDFNERDLPQVKSLCGFLQVSGCVIEFSPNPAGWSFYRLIEESIDRCDAFVAIVGRGHSCSTWLAHELHYAFTLNKVRLHARPRLFGIRIDDFEQPNMTKHVSLEWLDGSDESKRLLLEDLPDRILNSS